jgi:hypothetical protein
MKILHYIKTTILLLSAILLTVGCGGGGSGSTTQKSELGDARVYFQDNKLFGGIKAGSSDKETLYSSNGQTVVGKISQGDLIVTDTANNVLGQCDGTIDDDGNLQGKCKLPQNGPASNTYKDVDSDGYDDYDDHDERDDYDDDDDHDDDDDDDDDDHDDDHDDDDDDHDEESGAS